MAALLHPLLILHQIPDGYVREIRRVALKPSCVAWRAAAKAVLAMMGMHCWSGIDVASGALRPRGYTEVLIAVKRPRTAAL